MEKPQKAPGTGENHQLRCGRRTKEKMTLLELSAEYRANAQNLSARIALLESRIEDTMDQDQRLLLYSRIRMLRTMCREARDLAVLTGRYYERGYHRSGRYTV